MDAVEEAIDKLERRPSDTTRDNSNTKRALQESSYEPFFLNSTVWYNWAKTASCQPTHWHRPETKKQILDILRYALAHDQSVHVVGAGHSPSDMACTDGHLISMERFDRILQIDKRGFTVKAEAGITISTLNERLLEAGLALRNLGTTSNITLAGALCSGTHGTGIGFGVLASDVVELEILLADGTLHKCNKQNNRDLFMGALCSLGCLGVICTVTIKCEPAFILDALQYPLPFDHVMSDLVKLIHSAEHVRIWWFPHTDRCIIWQANRHTNSSATAPLLMPSPTSASVSPSITSTSLSSATTSPTTSLLTSPLSYLCGGHNIRELSNAIEQRSLELAYWVGTRQPKIIPYVNKVYQAALYNHTRSSRDLSFKIFSSGNINSFRGYVVEYAVPIDKVNKALLFLKRMIDTKQHRVHFPVEITFVKGDDIWLSPAYGGDTAFISVVMYRPYGSEASYTKYFKEFESIMSSLGGRPHWAKCHTRTFVELRKLYPRWKDFVDLRDKVDPNKIFWNDYLERAFGDISVHAQSPTPEEDVLPKTGNPENNQKARL